MSQHPAQDGYIWIQATGKPGMRITHAHGAGDVVTDSHHKGAMILVHRAELAMYLEGGCYEVAPTQPPPIGSVR